jgi:hypothetical protein
MINEVYLQIANPVNLVSHFRTRKEFENWLDIGTKKDLECALKAFEKEELYEYCEIIKNKIINI